MRAGISSNRSSHRGTACASRAPLPRSPCASCAPGTSPHAPCTIARARTAATRAPPPSRATQR
eukprot:5036127-Prymnesium_polylepis.3